MFVERVTLQVFIHELNDSRFHHFLVVPLNFISSDTQYVCYYKVFITCFSAMFCQLPNRHDVLLSVTPICDLRPGTFVNVAGVVCKAFQQPRLT